MREQSREHAGCFFIGAGGGASGGRNRCCSGVVVAAGVCMRSQLDAVDETVDPTPCCVDDSREEASLKNLASKTSASRCVARMRLIVSATNSLRNSGVHTVNAIG